MGYQYQYDRFLCTQSVKGEALGTPNEGKAVKKRNQKGGGATIVPITAVAFPCCTAKDRRCHR